MPTAPSDLEPERHIRGAVAHGVEPGDDEHGEAQHENDDEQSFVPRLLLALDRPAHAFAHELRVVAGDDERGDETQSAAADEQHPGLGPIQRAGRQE